VLYELPFVPAARFVEVIDNDDGATVIDTWPDAVCAGDPLSFNDTVNVELPLAVGVPETTPALESASPEGRLPDAMDHV